MPPCPTSRIRRYGPTCCPSRVRSMAGRVEKRVRLLMKRQQRRHFVTQRRVVRARLVEKRRPVRDRSFERRMKHAVDLRPPVGWHRRHAWLPLCSSRRSQALAIVQWRLTVAGDRPTASAVSSTVSPPKKRSSTMWAWCGIQASEIRQGTIERHQIESTAPQWSTARPRA